MLLAYRLPREPSSPRIAVWRKLKRLGVGQVLDGLVALPLDSRNREQLEWLAEEIVEAGGEATIWLAELALGSARACAGGRDVRAGCRRLREVIAEAEVLGGEGVRAAQTDARAAAARAAPDPRPRLLPAPEREAARQAIESLALSIEEPVR